MNFKDMLEKITTLSEATKETPTGKVHKAEPGGYGRKFDTDEEGDEKKEKKPEVKRGRGRPKKGSDDTGEVKKYDWSAFGVKSGKDVKLPKYDKSKTTKHSLKEYFDDLDKALNEAEQITIEPAKQNTQVIKQGTKTLGTVTNPQLAAQIKQSIGKGEMSLAGKEEMSEEDYSAKKARAGQDIGKPGKMFAKIAKKAGEKYGSKERGEKVAGAILAKLRAKTNEGDMPPNDSLSSPLTLEAKAAKPDFLDLDKDGNKKESMKKAAKDKKKVDEGMEHRHKAARHAGKAHALAKEGYNCRYDDMEEMRAYHEGYKEGLDECYGQMPVQGLVVGEETPAATVPGMASQAMPTMEDDVEEGNAFTAALAKTPKGGKFTVGGKTFTDKSNYNAKVDESPFAFEAWDNQLNELLNEGMSVSVSTGQPGMPESVSVNATDADADKLLAFVKQVGLGGLGAEPEASNYGVPVSGGDVKVVDDHDDMMSLIKKMTGGEEGQGEDYADEEGQEQKSCEVCGEAACDGHEDKELVDEVESEDQMTYEVAEDNAPDSDEAETSADEEAEAKEDAALAGADSGDEEEMNEGEELNEWANEAGKDGTDASFEQDIDFMTRVIAGGLNKEKSTGQTTIPVIAGQTDRMGTVNESDSLLDWLKLSGVK